MLEEFEENQFLPLFYEEMKKNGPNCYNKYAFPTQMLFLKVRVGRESICKKELGTYIIDRSMFEDRFIFAENAFQNGFLNDKEFEEYNAFFEKLQKETQPFDVNIYLRAGVDTVTQRIKSRGREMEEDIDVEYLGQLSKLYEEKFLPNLKKFNKNGAIFVYDVNDISEEELASKVYDDVKAVMEEKIKREAQEVEQE